MDKINICTLSDSYKLCHHAQYPDNTEVVYSYFESRKGSKFDNTVFFGLQYLLKKYLEGSVVTTEKVDFAEKLAAVHFGNDQIFNRERWDYIVEKYDGMLPVRIKSVPEGMPVPIDNVMMTIENTDPNCYWLTNHLETMLTWVWYSSGVATLSRETKKILKEFLDSTSDSSDGLPFKLHDFGFRGVSSCESAGIGGAAHLINFMGTDTIRAMEVALEYYNASLGSLAFSVPASEHSVMTSLGREGEAEQFKRMIDKYPTGIVSIVSDSYDIFNAVSEIVGKELKDQIEARDGTVVVRPDSGPPMETVVKLLEILDNAFGSSVNSKGFKVLNPKVRLIWGDGIDMDGIHLILGAIKAFGYSTDNIVFGMGGGLLQRINRDTMRSAFKASWMQRDGQGFSIQKTPLDMSKASKKGRLALVKVSGEYQTVEGCTGPVEGDILETVFENGKIVKEYTFEEIRKNASL